MAYYYMYNRHFFQISLKQNRESTKGCSKCTVLIKTRQVREKDLYPQEEHMQVPNRDKTMCSQG